jgi:hypothetical protein
MYYRNFTSHEGEQIFKIVFKVKQELSDAYMLVNDIVENILELGLDDYDGYDQWDFEYNNWDDEGNLVPETEYKGVIKVRNLYVRGTVDYDENEPRFGGVVNIKDDGSDCLPEDLNIAGEVIKKLGLEALSIQVNPPTLPDDAEINVDDY